MSGSDQKHWDRVYGNKGEFQVSWFQDDPALSLELIRVAAPSLESAIIDIGGGAARLVDALLAHDYRDVTVLDLSEAAIAISRARLGARAERVTWIAADVTRWRPGRHYDLWHDRAAFHFLTAAQDRVAYVERLMEALRPNGHAIIATFALEGQRPASGPLRCGKALSRPRWSLPTHRSAPAGSSHPVGEHAAVPVQRVQAVGRILRHT